MTIFIEKDVLSALLPTQAGAAIIDLYSGGVDASRFSCQAVYTVGTFSAAVIPVANITLSSNPTHPSSFQKTNHGLTTGLKVRATTAGTLATPLVVSTDYFVIKVDENYFQVASSLSNALAGIPIAITNVGVTSTTFTAEALAGGSVTFQKSNNKSNWIDIQTATSITVSGTVMIENPSFSYRYLKVVKGLTSGSIDLKAYLLVT